jgi:hypothetical protein
MCSREIELGDANSIHLAQRHGPVEGSCEHCNEFSGSIKCQEVPEWLHNWRLIKMGSALCS